MIRLVRPSPRFRSSYIEALEEHALASPHPEKVEEEIAGADAFIERQQNAEASYEAFWLVDGSRYIGTVQLRRKPANSQVYYDIRPSARGCGYARIMLKLATRVARARGLWPLTLEVDAKNAASVYLVQTCGGTEITDSAVTLVRRFQFS